MGFKMSDFTRLSTTLKLFVYLTWPKLGALLKLKILDDECTQYFKTCLLDIMQGREINNSSRPDFVQILLQAKAKGKIEMEKDEENEYLVGVDTQKFQYTDNDVVAQGVLFFMAGFETVATLFNYMAYELAINMDVQDKLLEEIDDII